MAVPGRLPQGGGSRWMGCRGVRVAETEPKAEDTHMLKNKNLEVFAL